MFDAAYSLLVVLRKVLPKGKVDFEMKVLKAVVSLVFHCVQWSHLSTSKENHLQLKDVANKLQGSFEDWIKSRFGDKFGGYDYSATKMNEEFQVSLCQSYCII